jgi:hypothetical protein
MKGYGKKLSGENVKNNFMKKHFKSLLENNADKYFHKFYQNSSFANTFVSLISSFVLSFLICFVFYPGFMSYDSLHALRAARAEVTDSIWPPMVSYVWRFVDLFSTNPSSMHFFQVFLLLFSISSALFLLFKKQKLSFIFILVYLSIPAILGTLAVIWKDVLMAAFFIAAFAVTLLLKRIKNSKLFFMSFLLASGLLLLGICSRHNAITAAVPLIFLLTHTFFSKFKFNAFKKIIFLSVSGIILILFSYTIKIQLDNYSFPNFVKLNAKFNDFSGLKILDIAGASICLDKNLFSRIDQNLKVADIEKMYDPKHCNLSARITGKFGGNKEIDSIWHNLIKEHPICFFFNKFNMMMYMMGANSGEQFLITHSFIDNNEFGYKLEDSRLREFFLSYIIGSSSFFFVKPWFIYLISIGSFVWLCRNKKLKPEYLAIYISGFFYFGSYILFGNAADARLLFYTTTTSSLIILVSFIEIFLKGKR